MPDYYSIRPATPSDLDHLNAIEEVAATRFQETNLSIELDQPPLPLAFLQKQQGLGLVWVAVTPHNIPVGFAIALETGRNYLHLHELSVEPNHGRQGVGSHLIQAVMQHAEQVEISAITLSTFRDIPWNAPFYRKLGFYELNETQIDSYLDRIRTRELETGLPVSSRILMRLDLPSIDRIQ